MLAWLCAGPCLASPWAEIGDSGLRADIEILAAAGVIPDMTSQWPLPWTSISHVLSAASLSDQPDWVRDAAQRVMEAAHRQTQDGMRAAVLVDLTNRTSVVRDFGSLGRGQGQTQFALDYN